MTDRWPKGLVKILSSLSPERISDIFFTKYRNRLVLFIQMIPDLQYGCKDKCFPTNRKT